MAFGYEMGRQSAGGVGFGTTLWNDNPNAAFMGTTGRSDGGGGGGFGMRQMQASNGATPKDLLFQRLNWGDQGTPATLAPAPRIDSGPIWDSQQIQGRVNSMRASNDASAANSTRKMQANLASRGYGSNSPLAQALQTQFSGQALAANTSGENDLRWNAAQGNADHVLQAQLGRSNQWNQANEQAIQNKRMQLEHQSSLMNLLAGLS